MDEPYTPCVIDFEDSGMTEFVLFDCATLYEPHSGEYLVIRDMETKLVIGFAWPTATPPKREVPEPLSADEELKPYFERPEHGDWTDYCDYMDNLEAQVQRLRENLETIADSDWNDVDPEDMPSITDDPKLYVRAFARACARSDKAPW